MPYIDSPVCACIANKHFNTEDRHKRNTLSAITFSHVNVRNMGCFINYLDNIVLLTIQRLRLPLALINMF